MIDDLGRGSARRLLGSALLLVACLGASASGATASVGLTTGATSHATLAVDAAGDVQVTWTQGATTRTVHITAAGTLTHGGSLGAPDVSKPAHVPGLVGALVVRSVGASFWALQSVAPTAGHPVSLDLSHWSGALPKVTLASDGTRISGTASFAGKPVTGHTTTPYGLKPRIYVYLDCLKCGGKGGWVPMLGVAPHADGSFAVLLRANWKGTRYRATLDGPNHGTTYAPVVVVTIAG